MNEEKTTESKKCDESIIASPDIIENQKTNNDSQIENLLDEDDYEDELLPEDDEVVNEYCEEVLSQLERIENSNISGEEKFKLRENLIYSIMYDVRNDMRLLFYVYSDIKTQMSLISIFS